MIKTYIKIAFRNLIRNQSYSFINIFGLAVGMTVALLIGLWIWDELSFNAYFKNHQRLAQVMLNQTEGGVTYTGGTIAMPTGDVLRTKYAADFEAVSLASWIDKHLVYAGDKAVSSSGMWVQQDFPEMLSRLAPKDVRYHHDNTWHDGNGHSHVRASLVGPSLTVPFSNRDLILGTWQQIVMLEMDTRRRERVIVLQILGE